MPKEKGLYESIPKIYRHQSIDNFLFGYAIAFKRCDSDVSLKDVLLMFSKDFGLSEDEYPLESMLQKWYKMSHDYINEKKTC